MTRILRGEQWAEALLAAFSSQDVNPALWMERESRIVKRDHHSLVGFLQLCGRACYLKYYRPKGVLQRLQFRLGRGRGVASFDNAWRLRQAGLTVAEPLACVLVRGGVLLLSEGIESGRDLKTLWMRGLPDAQQGPLFERLATALASLHGSGFCHGDSKWSNFLVTAEAVYLVDLEAVDRCAVEGRGCSRDLARFTVNAEDMGLGAGHYRVFLERYCSDLGLPVDSVIRRLLPDLERFRRRHLVKYGERGHRLVQDAGR